MKYCWGSDTSAGTTLFSGASDSKPRYMRVLIIVIRSERSLSSETITSLALSCSSANSNSSVMASFEPSGRPSSGMGRTSFRPNSIASHICDTDESWRSLNVIHTGVSDPPLFSFSGTVGGCADFAVVVEFPTHFTPDDGPLDCSDRLPSAWGTSGAPQRPRAQRDAVVVGQGGQRTMAALGFALDKSSTVSRWSGRHHRRHSTMIHATKRASNGSLLFTT